MLSLFTFAAAIIPSILLIRYVATSDKYPEPAHMLWKTFGGGVLIVIPVLIVALPAQYLIEHSPITHFPIGHGFTTAFLTAAFPEEFFKLLVLVLFCARSPEFDEPMDGIVYGAVASLGFATFENILYVMGGGLPLAIMRGLTAVPAHASFGVIMGYFYARAHFSEKNKIPLYLLAYFIPVLLHGLYDAFLFCPVNISAQYTDGAEMSNHDSFITAISFLGCFLVLGFMVHRAYRFIKLMQKEQESI